MIDKEKAIELRQAGLSYSEIATEVGCSEVWCKKYLKDVVKNSAEKEAISRCVELAKTASGITYGEISKEIISIGINPYPDKAVFDRAMKRFKSGINKVPGTLIRPYWMQPEESKQILQDVLLEINCLDERMWESVCNIRNKYGLDDSYNASLYRVITDLLYCKHKGIDIDLGSKLQHLGRIALELHERNPNQQKEPKFLIYKDIPYLDDVPY